MMRVVSLVSVLVEHTHGIEDNVSSKICVENGVDRCDLVVSDELHDQERVSIAASYETDAEYGHPGTEEGGGVDKDVVPETE